MIANDDDAQIRLLMRVALDDAFKLQVATLYKIWLTNPGDMAAARGRAATGLHSAIKAYREGIAAVAAWEG